jgi:hypothetical protein
MHYGVSASPPLVRPCNSVRSCTPTQTARPASNPVSIPPVQWYLASVYRHKPFDRAANCDSVGRRTRILGHCTRASVQLEHLNLGFQMLMKDGPV